MSLFQRVALPLELLRCFQRWEQICPHPSLRHVQIDGNLWSGRAEFSADDAVFLTANLCSVGAFGMSSLLGSPTNRAGMEDPTLPLWAHSARRSSPTQQRLPTAAGKQLPAPFPGSGTLWLCRA